MFIITDGLTFYNKAISDEFSSLRNKTTHIGNVGIRGKKNGEDILTIILLKDFKVLLETGIKLREV